MQGAAVSKNIRRTGIPASSPEHSQAFLLTLRQQRVCELIALGMTNKEIAEVVGIGVRTVETHRDAIFRKAGVRNAVELTRKILGAV